MKIYNKYRKEINYTIYPSYLTMLNALLTIQEDEDMSLQDIIDIINKYNSHYHLVRFISDDALDDIYRGIDFKKNLQGKCYFCQRVSGDVHMKVHDFYLADYDRIELIEICNQCERNGAEWIS